VAKDEGIATLFDYFLADRTNNRAIGTVLRPSVVCRLSSSVWIGMYCG